MNHNRVLLGFVGYLALVCLLTACSAPPQTPTVTPLPSHTSTPAHEATLPPASSPTVTPTVALEEPNVVWNLLIFGDAITGQAHWPNMLSAYVEEDLGVDVALKNKAGGFITSDELLVDVHERESLRKEISEAEMIVLLILDDAAYPLVVYNDYSRDCSSSEYEKMLDSIVKEIIVLRGSNPLVLRLLEHYNYPGRGKKGFEGFDIRKACFEQYNASIHAVAVNYNISVIPVYKAFNGLNGDENPLEKGYLKNGEFLDRPGDRVIVDLIRESGYEPID